MGNSDSFLKIQKGVDGGVYLPLGKVSLKIGEVKYSLVNNTFRPSDYIDYSKTASDDEWHTYGLFETDKLQLRPLPTEYKENNNIRIDPDIYREIIPIIFEHN